MVTEYRKERCGISEQHTHGEENIVGKTYSELQNHHKTEALSQNNKYDEERESQKIIPRAIRRGCEKKSDNNGTTKGPL